MYRDLVVEGSNRQWEESRFPFVNSSGEANLPPQHYPPQFNNNSSFSQTSSIEGFSLSQLCSQQPVELTYTKRPVNHAPQECVRDRGCWPNVADNHDRCYTQKPHVKSNIFGGRGTGSSQQGLSVLLSTDLLKKSCHTQPKAFPSKHVYGAPQHRADDKEVIPVQGSVIYERKELCQTDLGCKPNSSVFPSKIEPQCSSMEYSDSKTCQSYREINTSSLLYAPSTVPRRFLDPTVSAESQNSLVSEMDSELMNMTDYCQSRKLILRELSPAGKHNNIPIMDRNTHRCPTTEEVRLCESPIACNGKEGKDFFENTSTLLCDDTPSSISSSVRLNNNLSGFSLHQPTLKHSGITPKSKYIKDSPSFQCTVGAPVSNVDRTQINHNSESLTLRIANKFPSIFTLLSPMTSQDFASSNREHIITHTVGSHKNSSLYTPPGSHVDGSAMRVSGSKTPRSNTQCQVSADLPTKVICQWCLSSQSILQRSLGVCPSNDDLPSPAKKRKGSYGSSGVCDMCASRQHASLCSNSWECTSAALSVPRCQPSKSTMYECIAARVRLLSDSISDMRDGIVEMRTIMCPNRPLSLNLDKLLQMTGQKVI